MWHPQTEREGQKWCRGARLQRSLSYHAKPASTPRCSCTATAPQGWQLLPPAVQWVPALPPRHHQSKGWGKRQVTLSMPQPRGRSRAGHSYEVVIENPGQTPKDRQLQTKPAESFTSALPAHPGSGEQLVSCEHMARDSLQDTPVWRTPQPQLGSLHSFPKARVTHPINPKSGSWAGFCGWGCGGCSRALSGTEKCCLLHKYTHPQHLLTVFLYIL